jgi:glycosyltransferase involved in cell wall biosynthesis
VSFSETLPRILCTFGGTSSRWGISGGDRHSLEVWRNWQDAGRVEIIVCASAFGADVCQKFGYDLVLERFERRSKEVGPWRLEYVGRLVRQLRLLARMGTAAWGYSASAYYYDVVPLAIMQFFARLKFAIVPVFHLVPAPNERGWTVQNIAAWVEQRVVLRILRCMRVAIVVDNDRLLSDLVKLGFRRRNVILSGMGVPGHSSDLGRAQNDGVRFDCIYVGRLSAAKGVTLLLEAWSAVCKSMPGARLALVGSRDSSLDADAFVRSVGLSQEQAGLFEGLSDAEVQNMLRHARCFAIASREEGYCLAIGEAMREGLPCVTFDLPAFRFAYPYGRVIVSRNNVGDFAGAMRNLLNDQELYKRLVTDIRRHYSFRSWQEVAEELWNACAELADEERVG